MIYIKKKNNLSNFSNKNNNGLNINSKDLYPLPLSEDEIRKGAKAKFGIKDPLNGNFIDIFYLAPPSFSKNVVSEDVQSEFWKTMAEEAKKSGLVK